MTYRTIDPDTLDARAAYALQASYLVPRPIAWVATVGEKGVLNCAPFSFFMGVSSQPPIVAIAVAERRTGRKDTVRNIERQPEFTVNIVNEDLAAKMVETSADFPYGVSEFDAVGLTPVPSETVAAPRIAGAPVQMECRLHKLEQVEGTKTTLILGRVVRVHIDTAVLDSETGLVDIRRLRPVGRLGGNAYCRVRDTFDIPRPPRPAQAG